MLWPLLPLLLCAGWVWAPIVGLSFTGEDYVILSRLNLGQVGSPHVYRPLSDAWMGTLHGVFGADARAFHAATLALHLVNTTLLYLLAVELLRSRAGAVCVASLFALGAGSMDALAWNAAVNRPLSASGLLLVLHGLSRFREFPRGAAGLVLGGLVVQYFSNEEVYGTALLVVAWLGAFVLRVRTERRLALGIIAGTILAILVHYFVLHRLPASGDYVLSGGLTTAPGSIATRANEIAVGLGFPVELGLLFVAAGAALLALARRRDALVLGGLVWCASLIPFALSEAVGYRFYVTVVPTAILVGGGIWAVIHRFVPALRGTKTAAVVPVLVLILAWLGSEPRRRAGLEAWREALHEVAISAEAAQGLAREGDERPVLVNLASSSAGPFFYAFGLTELEDIALRSFLDAASGYEDMNDDPPGIWWGRRFDGSYGVFEQDSYFQARPVVDALRLYDSVLVVESLDEAQTMLRRSEFDLLGQALVETSRERVGDMVTRTPKTEIDGAALVVLEPFEGVWGSARMRVGVRAPHTVLLAYQDHWVFDCIYHYSPDQLIITGESEPRRIQMRAVSSTGEEWETFHVNGYGMGAVVPPGDHEVELSWSFVNERDRP